MSTRLLITGGSGFIGTPLVEIAAADGNAVVNLDIAAPRNDAHRPFWREVDVRDAGKVNEVMREFAPDYVLHLASDIDITITKIEGFTTTINGTRTIIEAARGLPLKRLMHTSTQYVVKPGVVPKDERHLLPYTIYGEAKAEAEKLVWAAELPFPWTIVRPVNIWGPAHPTLSEEILRHIASRRYLHPTGTIKRAYGYVENVARQMYRLATRPATEAGDRHVFYLGDGAIDFGAWVDAFSLELTGAKARRIPSTLLHLLGKAGDIAKTVGLPAPVDSGRAFRMTTSDRGDLAPTLAVTGRPEVSFDEGIAATVAWLRQINPERFGAPKAGAARTR